jgi:DNA primase
MREAKRALVVEGYMDVLALAQHGVGYAVATLGTATSPVHVTRLLRELRESGSELVFCFDGDSAGRKAAWRALEVSLPLATDTTAMRFLFLPEGEDPDSFVRAHGKEAFERLIAPAQTLSGFLLGELRAQSDLATAEGRARFQVTARPFVQRLAAPALRQQLIRAVAQLAQMAPEYADSYFAPQGEARPRRPAAGRALAPILKSEEQHLLRCVVTHPALAEELDEALLDPDLPEAAALRALAADLADAEGASGAVLVERYQGTQFEKAVFQAQESAIEQGVTPESAAQEFRQLQIALRIRRKHHEIEALKGQVEANPALNAELHLRVKELHQLKAQRS